MMAAMCTDCGFPLTTGHDPRCRQAALATENLWRQLEAARASIVELQSQLAAKDALLADEKEKREAAEASLARRDALHAMWHTCAVCSASLVEADSVPFCEDCGRPDEEQEETWRGELNAILDSAPKETG